MAVGVDSYDVWLATAAFGDPMVVCAWRLARIIGSVEQTEQSEKLQLKQQVSMKSESSDSRSVNSEVTMSKTGNEQVDSL
jgi:hypothetical protein